MVKQLIKSETFLSELINKIENTHGIPKKDIVCILLCGSALYFDDVHDIDLKVMLKTTANVSQKSTLPLEIQDIKVDCLYYTFASWKAITKMQYPCQFVTESPDMECIYGDDSKFYRYDVLKSESLKKYIVTIWDRYFFNIAKRTDIKLFSEKRLWNFLLFAYKIVNNTHTLSTIQREHLQKAHDNLLNKEDYIDLYNIVLSKIYT